jgi:hypothetical protein
MTPFEFPPGFRGVPISHDEHVELLKRTGTNGQTVLTSFGSRVVLLPEQSNVWAFYALREMRKS